MSPAKSSRSALAKKKATPSKKATKKAVAVKKKAPARKTATRAPAKTTPVAISTRNAKDYKRALGEYAKCMKLVQKKNWESAGNSLAHFIADNPAERELSERARMYLRVCSQHLQIHEEPEDFDERYYAAVVLSNQGEYDKSLAVLKEALIERPESKRALYLQASTLTLKGDRRAALAALARAIELDEQNRIYAANDPDFQGLRDDEEFITLTTREDDEDL